MPEQIHVQF